MDLYTVGIWERRPELSGLLERSLDPARRAEVRLYPLRELPRSPDLLVIAPDAEEAAGMELHCRALLVPGLLWALGAKISAVWSISYGVAARDSLTLSSMGERKVALALQRELVTLAGTSLERQELLLPRNGHTSPLHFLACAGTLLLLGVPPEEVLIAPPE